MPATTASQPSTDLPQSICLDAVTPEAVSWLWTQRIPKGKLTLLDGDPGLGKSTLTLAIAAAVSSGKPMPGEREGGPEGRVLLVCVEDGLQDTIVPRLKAAGANLANVYSFQTTTDLREDLGKLRACIEERHIDFVILDPLIALLGADANNDQRCRAVLTPLASVAAETGAAILMVRHLTKAGSRMAIHRGGGSMGIIGAARSALLFTVDPNDPASRVLAASKSNLGPLAPSLRLTF